MESKSLVKWDEELSKHAKAIAETERPALANISLQGGVMTYESQRIPENKLKVIVLAALKERRFYLNKFVPGKPEAPDCFAFLSDDISEELMSHHAASFKPQHDGVCSECPQNQWGSNPNSPSGRGKNCSLTRKLCLLPQHGSGKEMALVSVPVMSVKNWSNYVNEVAATVARPPWAVITEISLHPNQRSQFEVKFACVGLVPEDQLGTLYERIALAKTILSTPYDKTNPPETAGGVSDPKAKSKKY